MPIRVPNQKKQASGLFVFDSDLDRFLAITTRAVQSQSFNWEKTLAAAKNRIRLECTVYQSKSTDKMDYVCASGERDGIPVKPECLRCIVSNFSSDGSYVGDILPVAVLPTVEAGEPPVIASLQSM